MSLDNYGTQIRRKLDLVIDKLTSLGTNDEVDAYNGMDSLLIELNRRDSGIDIWDWPQGVGLYGLHKYLEYEHNEKYAAFLKDWYDRHMAGEMPLRNINTTAPMLTFVDFIDGNPEYEKFAIDWAQWLMHGLARTEEGGFQHVTSGSGDGKSLRMNDQQLWVDTLFMAVLFLNRMGQKFHRDDWIDESIHQVLMHIKYLCDPCTGLFYHGWTFKDRNHFGGIFWCRGDSWFTMGILDYIDMFADTLPKSVKDFILDTYRAQVRALIPLQSESGLWHTILDDPTSYEESSGTAAIAAGILHGIRTGVLEQDECYISCAGKAIRALLDNIAEDGTVLKVSAGTAMGMDAQHYKNIMIAPMAYGQSLTIFALLEALRQPALSGTV